MGKRELTGETMERMHELHVALSNDHSKRDAINHAVHELKKIACQLGCSAQDILFYTSNRHTLFNL